MDGFIIVICFIVAIFAFFMAYYSYKEQKEKEKKEIERENKRIERALKKAEKQIEFRRKNNEEMDAKYGECTLCIPRSVDAVEGTLRVYENAHVIVLDNKLIVKFEEIRACEVTNIADKISPNKSSTVMETHVSGKSMVGRAVVGAAVAGPVGAIVGGATAKRVTTSKENLFSGMRFNYFYLNVYLNNLENPMYQMACGRDIERATKMENAINAVIGKYNENVL